MGNQVAGKVSLITGGASGIGAGIAKLFAEEGAKVIVADVDVELGTRVADQIGHSAVFLELDVSSKGAWNHARDFVQDKYGRLDILVNNAGITILGSVEDMAEQDFDRVMAVNCTGTAFGCQTMLPLLKMSDHASIVNVVSTGSHQGFGMAFAYSSSKGAVRSMTKSIAAYCQDQGYKIRCNSVHPNEIETPMMENVLSLKPRGVPEGVLPFGSHGAPSDVAAAVLFLGSEAARFITGTELMVDNGSSMRPPFSSVTSDD
ncbi:SDR family oxidoreductase [Croceicoccus sediminis]|uniref:SDR family oxidoreductase n=1 Tax=Croceicoccus sediminis TaxID=2571150 RepID=UPI0011842ED5|nr:SDR family oxidoreductase [Croceicoccus sediminis]